MPAEDQVARVADLEGERRVDDVRRGEAVVDPAALRPELLGHRVDEGGQVVIGRLLDLGDPLGCRHLGAVANRGNVCGGHRSDLDPAVEGRQFDLEPARQLALLRPDPAHLRTGVAGDHSGQSRAGSGGRREREDPRSEHSRILRVVDTDRRDRDARRHLHDREQCVEAVEHRHRGAQRARRSPAVRCARRRRPAAPPRGRRRRSAPSARGSAPTWRTRPRRRASGAPSAPRTPRGCPVRRARRERPASVRGPTPTRPGSPPPAQPPATAAMSRRNCVPSNVISSTAAYACARASATVLPVPVTERILPPFVTTVPSRTAVPPWKTSAPVASAASRPEIGAPAWSLRAG